MAVEDVQAEPSVVTSLSRAIEAGQQLVVNRIDLARLDVMRTLGRISRSAVLIALGGLVAFVGWVALTAAAILFGEPYMTLAGSAVAVGLLNAALGAALVIFGLQRGQYEEPLAESARRQGNDA